MEKKKIQQLERQIRMMKMEKINLERKIKDLSSKNIMLKNLNDQLTKQL